jgi:hypothetical protein
MLDTAASLEYSDVLCYRTNGHKLRMFERFGRGAEVLALAIICVHAIDKYEPVSFNPHMKKQSYVQSDAPWAGQRGSDSRLRVHRAPLRDAQDRCIGPALRDLLLAA